MKIIIHINIVDRGSRLLEVLLCGAIAHSSDRQSEWVGVPIVNLGNEIVRKYGKMLAYQKWEKLDVNIYQMIY